MKNQVDSGVTDSSTLKPQTTQTRYHGSHEDRYFCYLQCADDGDGNEIMTGLPLKSFEEWLNS